MPVVFFCAHKVNSESTCWSKTQIAQNETNCQVVLVKVVEVTRALRYNYMALYEFVCSFFGTSFLWLKWQPIEYDSSVGNAVCEGPFADPLGGKVPWHAVLVVRPPDVSGNFYPQPCRGSFAAMCPVRTGEF